MPFTTEGCKKLYTSSSRMPFTKEPVDGIPLRRSRVGEAPPARFAFGWCDFQVAPCGVHGMRKG